MDKNNNISLKKYLETRIEDNDKRYEQRFISQEKAVQTAFDSSDKAIEKAEVAQRLYNEKSNEIRAQLNDQAKTFAPKVETDNKFNYAEDRTLRLEKSVDDKLEALRVSTEKATDQNAKDIANLREFRSEGVGKSLGINQFWGYIIGAFGIGAAIVTIISKIAGL